MIRNYLKIAWRNVLKHKAYSAINLVGLTVGLSACALIGLYIRYQASFDDFQPKANRIARVIMEYRFSQGQESVKGNFTSTRVAPTFARTFPEVQAAVHMTSHEETVRYQDKLVTEPSLMYADSSFFDVFESQMLTGNPRQALNGPFKVVLTQSTAQKYFGPDNPVGQVMLVGPDSQAYQVTGVIADYP